MTDGMPKVYYPSQEAESFNNDGDGSNGDGSNGEFRGMDWLTDWFTHALTHSLTHSFTDQPTDRLTDWWIKKYMILLVRDDMTFRSQWSHVQHWST